MVNKVLEQLDKEELIKLIEIYSKNWLQYLGSFYKN